MTPRVEKKRPSVLLGIKTSSLGSFPIQFHEQKKGIKDVPGTIRPGIDDFCSETS